MQQAEIVDSGFRERVERLVPEILESLGISSDDFHEMDHPDHEVAFAAYSYLMTTKAGRALGSPSKISRGKVQRQLEDVCKTAEKLELSLKLLHRVTRFLIRSGINKEMDTYVTNLARHENHLLHDLILATKKGLANLPPVKKHVTLYPHAPKSRLAVDCLIIFTKYCAECPTSTTEGKFHKFVQDVYHLATGGEPKLERTVKAVIKDWKAGKLDLTAIGRFHYQLGISD